VSYRRLNAPGQRSLRWRVKNGDDAVPDSPLYCASTESPERPRKIVEVPLVLPSFCSPKSDSSCFLAKKNVRGCISNGRARLGRGDLIKELRKLL